MLKFTLYIVLFVLVVACLAVWMDWPAVFTLALVFGTMALTFGFGLEWVTQIFLSESPDQDRGKNRDSELGVGIVGGLMVAVPMVILTMLSIPVSHVLWYGPAHRYDMFAGFVSWNKYTQMHSTGVVMQRGTTDGKELGHSQYLVVRMGECGIRLFEMNQPEPFYPEQYLRVVVKMARLRSACAAPIVSEDVPAGVFRVSGA